MSGSLPVVLLAEAGRIARDRLDRRPADDGVLPARLTAVTARWLGTATGAVVRSVSLDGAQTGTTARATVRVESDRLPATVFVKLAPPRLSVRAFVDLVGLGRSEVRFYRELSSSVPVAVPACHGAAADPRTGRFALVLEDLAARDVTFADLTAPVGVDRARAVLSALARLHAGFWASPRFMSDLAWLSGPDGAVEELTRRLVLRALRTVRRRFPHDVPAGFEGDLAWLADHYGPVTDALERGPHTLLHGDPHLGNIAFGAGEPVFFDWQVVRRGPAFRDVAYFLVLSLDPAMRSAHEETLVHHYAAALADAGGPDLGPEVAWEHYRVHGVDPLVAAAFTAVAGGMQARAVATTGLRRAVEAARRLGSVDALRAGAPVSI